MRKIFKAILFVTILYSLIFPLSSYAEVYEDLDTLDITLSKDVVNPGEDVTININFGKLLGSYDINIDFDDALFDYKSTSTGTAGVSGSMVSISFFDTLNPATAENVTFTAKSGITTSNPTQFLITLTGMANPDDTVRFNDTVPIIKDVVVEPAYVNYEIFVEYSGPIVKDEEKAIDVRIKSSMGRYYDHLRLIAEVKTPARCHYAIIRN